MWVADVSRYFQRQNSRAGNSPSEATTKILESGVGDGGEGGGSEQGKKAGSGGSGTFGLWKGLRRRTSSSSSKKAIAGGGDKGDVQTSGGGVGGSQEYGWKPMSKNSREYFQEIVETGDDKAGAHLAQHDSGNSQGSNSQEYKWKKLQKSSREYFRDLLGNELWSEGKIGGRGEFDPSDYERTPPASPMDHRGKNGRDVVEASLSLPKLVRKSSHDNSSGGSREFKGGE